MSITCYKQIWCHFQSPVLSRFDANVSVHLNYFLSLLTSVSKPLTAGDNDFVVSSAYSYNVSKFPLQALWKQTLAGDISIILQCATPLQRTELTFADRGQSVIIREALFRSVELIHDHWIHFFKSNIKCTCIFSLSVWRDWGTCDRPWVV